MTIPRERAAKLMRDVQTLLAAPTVPADARSAAVERAIGACENALELLGDDDRQARGTVWFNLGVCWHSRLAGDPGENAEHAVASFHAALALRDRETELTEWAKTQNALGVAWNERRHGDPGENKRAAIAALELALSVRRKLGDDDYVAASLTNLANVRVEIAGDDRSANIEQAIGEYEEALALLDADNAETRGPVLRNLATALLERSCGDRGENVDRAIKAVEQSLRLRPQPQDEHTAKLALANALGLRLTGIKADDLERAVALVNEVVAYREQHESPERQASAHNSRGILYARRIRGGRADNIEQAVASHRQALDGYTAEARPGDRAGTLNNLATALRARLLGDRERNEDEAITVLHEALEVYTRDTDPYSWAGTMSNLGTAYFERRTGDVNEHIDHAIVAYHSALEVRREETLPWEWAATQFNLGQALWRRQRGDRAANLRDAADALTATLRVRTPERTPDEWAATQSMLAVVYDELAELGDCAIDEAIIAYENALSIYRPETFPSEARANANNLAGALLRRNEPARALEVARVGLRAAELLYGAAPTEDGREHEVDDNARLYRLASEAALQSGRPHGEVFELGEGGRGRLLGDWLAATSLDAPADVDPGLLEQEAQSRAELREALVEARRSLGNEDRARAVARADHARHALDDLWSEMASHPAAVAYVAQRRGDRLSADGLQAWLDAQPGRPAIVVLSALRERPVAFVAVAGADGPTAIRYRAGHDDVNRLLARLDRELIRATTPARKESWTEIGELLIAPALDALGDNVSLLYVVPLGGLHAVPWHASVVDGLPLLERFPMAYAPSASSAARLASTTPTTPLPDRGAAVIGDPGDNLKYARHEAELVAAQLGATPLLGTAATAEAALAALAATNWAHLAAHGHYDSDDPLSSGVAMADRVLAARELIDGRAPDAVVVSSCESGRQSAAAGDELWGLGRALLYAGTRTAVLSLWRVGDRVTERLMLRFYDALRAQHDPGSPVIANALREAMLQTREKDPRSFFWAPFTLLGNPY